MYKLLLVDDEPIIRQGLEQMIDWDKLGLTLTASCSNAIAALDSMMDDMPDILLTDIRLPGMSGLDLVGRAVALHPMLQTVILSGYDTFQYAQQAVKYGVIEYLLKPCSQQELESALQRACQALDRQNQQVLYLYGERRKRVKALVDRFRTLQKDADDAPLLEKQVHELVKTVEDPSLLQETLISLVTESMSSGQAEWGVNVIADALHSQDALEGLIVHTLSRLRRESGQGGRFCPADDRLCGGPLRRRIPLSAIHRRPCGLYERRLYRPGVHPDGGAEVQQLSAGHPDGARQAADAQRRLAAQL